MVEEESKLVRVYLEDWERLNKYLSLLQVKTGKRLTFADVIQALLEGLIEPKIEALIKDIARS